jgi:hypothetical protein
VNRMKAFWKLVLMLTMSLIGASTSKAQGSGDLGAPGGFAAPVRDPLAQ